MNDNLNIYVFTTKHVIKKKYPVVRVLHDEEGNWQFLGDESNLTESDAIVISLEEMLAFDETLKEITTLPIGKQALRNDKGELWYIYDL